MDEIMNQMLTAENRSRLTVTGVADVESFDEDSILLALKQGGLLVRGENLKIHSLDPQQGRVLITGMLQSFQYTEKRQRQEGGFLKRLLK
ncbi:MAG: sporulation protein YabP [Clostridiales bacterium]|nr:sporulation protein YabP [Clostridiales bacterium]